MPLEYLDAEFTWRIKILEFIFICFNFKNFQALIEFLSIIYLQGSLWIFA